MKIFNYRSFIIDAVYKLEQLFLLIAVLYFLVKIVFYFLNVPAAPPGKWGLLEMIFNFGILVFCMGAPT